MTSLTPWSKLGRAFMVLLLGWVEVVSSTSRFFPHLKTQLRGADLLATTRSSDFRSLSLTIIDQLHIGVLPTSLYKQSADANTLSESLNIMPLDWVRGAMLIRSNSLIRGHSGVRWRFIRSIVDLLNKGITPVCISYFIAGCHSNNAGRLSQLEGVSAHLVVRYMSFDLRIG